ncbi:hypothetical protein C3K47_16880 [Solitalea longa]|uniref:Uncharacterized protein n=1 Tax=Solitalea longa TaxID=2079460 RepID=A0A2S4ZYK5_9SPHI|nr:hypothetical protein [Solitalea longa]POY35077.1 hypothetical protein C3K47_16880 [Solitalea longa]
MQIFASLRRYFKNTLIQILLPFLKRFAVFSIIIALVIGGIQYLLADKQLLMDKIWLIYFFYSFITLFSFVLASYGLKKGGEFSVLAVLVSVVFKMLLCMSMALVFIYKNMVTDKWAFISNFFLLYLLYTIFEVYNLIYNLRDQKKLENR